MAFSDNISFLKEIGPVSSIKTVYYSLKHTGSLYSLVIGPKTIVDINSGTEFDLPESIIFGATSTRESNPLLRRSLLSTGSGAQITSTGPHAARIGPGTVVRIEGEFSMGDSFMNGDCRIICEDKITIGDEVAIAWDVTILDTDRHNLIIKGERTPATSPIEIKDHVWIGHGATISKGVTINEGAVIASNSVVTKDVPPRTLVGGVPAEIIHENIQWEP
ncbi:acyltransferase [Haloterrigena sp. SYSU A558-1]|uniref:Acyltransferase n=1 Tax=Haloterrigena gelatinilytica TaxID=2741724 RepID=A0ABX2LBL0_9EURY|nr:acyltransferase [Haloterrigena gelatinilytica]NUC72770.1 acyltransferase [Haloterrigena gelatinilytica]